MNGNNPSLDKSIDSRDGNQSDNSDTEEYYKPSSDNSLTIFVYNIDPEATEEILKTSFSSFGNIAKLTLNRIDQIKLFLYIQYDHPASVDKALKEGQYMKIGKSEVLIVKRQEGTKLNPRGKLFVRGIADQITVKDLHEHFGQISNNFLVFKFSEHDIRPINTGFVHFFDHKDAKRALETLQGKELKESKLELSEWDPKGLKRAKAAPGLYIANLPENSKTELEDKFLPIFKTYGEIANFAFNDQKFAAIVHYKDPQDAKEAFENLTKQEGCSNFAVSWAKSLTERKEENKKRRNRLHLDGLRYEVTHEMIKAEFSRFGYVVSLDTKPGRIVERRIKTQWAVIAFSTDEEAERAIFHGGNTKEIKRLFVPNYLKIQFLGQPNKDNLNQKPKNQFFQKSKPQSLHETTPKSQAQSEPQGQSESQEPHNSDFQFPPGMQPFGGNQPLIPFDEQLPPHMIQPQPQQSLHFNQPMIQPIFQHMLPPQSQPQFQQPPFNFMPMNPQFPSLPQHPLMNMPPQAQNFMQQPPPSQFVMGNSPQYNNTQGNFNHLMSGWGQPEEILTKPAHPLYSEIFNIGNIMPIGNIGDGQQQPKSNLDHGLYGDIGDASELNDPIMFNLSFMDEKPPEKTKPIPQIIEPVQPIIEPSQYIQPTEPAQPAGLLSFGNINPEDFLKKSLGMK